MSQTEIVTRAFNRINKLREAYKSESSLMDFAEYVWPVVEPAIPFVKGWVLEAICEHLEAVTAGQIRRLLINVPPGFTKSLMTDVFWPAWEWGPRNMPWNRYVCASYSNHLTERDNMRCRNVVLSDRYKRFWGDRFKISNDHTGWKLATSVGGIGVGERGDRFIIDDANNTMMMESEATRDNVNMWFTEVVPDRLNNQQTSAIVVIQQRLHEDDVSGTALSREMGYTHLMIPMEHDTARHCVTSLGWTAEGREIIWEDPRTEENELAWPERFPVQSVEELRRDKGPYAWCSTAEAPILMADLSMKRIDEIRVGDKIVGFKIGDRERRARLKCGEVLSISKTFQPIVKITLNSGEVVRCTPNHKWWTGRNDATHAPYAPATLRSTLSRVCPPRLPTLAPEDIHLAGWLSGFFDGEGTVSINHRRPDDEGSALIAFSQGDGRNGPLCDKLEYALEHFGFNFGVWEKPHRGKDKTDNHKMRTYWLKMAKEGRASRLPLYQRFLHIVKPTKWRERLIECATSGRLYTGAERVISIQPDGSETVYGLETTTGNYVAWGLASSNSGQYQQSPEPRGGSIIKRDFWQLWEEDIYPKFDFIVASLDPAFTAKEENDPSALTVWGVFREKTMMITQNGAVENYGDPKVMLIWAMQERMEFHALMELVVDVCTVDKKMRAHPRFPVDKLLIESKASGLSVGQEMYRLYGMSGRFGIDLIDPKIYGDKVARVQSIQHLFSSGMIYAPDRAFATMVIDQCAVFPKGSKDDLVDSTSQALRWLRDSGFTPSKDESRIHRDEDLAYREPLQPLYPV